MLKNILFFLMVGLSIPCFPWSANGHRVVGEIAYMHLDADAKETYAHINQSLNHQYRQYSLIGATVWLDVLYDAKHLAFKPMHYIDLPYKVDDTPAPKLSKVNAVSAINDASRTLLDKTASEEEQAIALRILLHVVGDVHQPLHTITRISQAHPQGDRGGNDFHLGKNKIAPNLHRYWDRGGGLLSSPMSTTEVKQLAENLETQWSCPKENLDAMHWAEESHLLAIQYAYAIQEDAAPTETYEANTRKICGQQLVYAGCRLAALLNSLKRRS
ncbi:MAG: S1/P1 nuclease [Gammaproteobacteria bacterium]|nr:S1/P1 nuclease [Gammaproteobacteria bacterium]